MTGEISDLLQSESSYRQDTTLQVAPDAVCSCQVARDTVDMKAARRQALNRKLPAPTPPPIASFSRHRTEDPAANPSSTRSLSSAPRIGSSATLTS